MMSEEISDYRVVHSSPLILQLAHFLQHNGIRGGHFLEETARARGWLDVLVRFELSRNVRIDVPAFAGSYDLSNIHSYEHDLIGMLERRISHSPGKPLTLLDCGADIGLFSALLVASCDRIERVIAFEPNSRSFAFLERNLKMLPLPGEAHNRAVADFVGKGELRYPDHDKDDHAAFIVPAEGGEIEVTTIDRLGLPSGQRLLMKIDVEGGELAVVEGAQSTLASSSQFNVVFEAHRDQVGRTGIDPLTIVNFLNRISPCDVVVAEAPDTAVDLGRPFFDQFPNRIYNVCVFSRQGVER